MILWEHQHNAHGYIKQAAGIADSEKTILGAHAGIHPDAARRWGVRNLGARMSRVGELEGGRGGGFGGSD